MEAYRKGIQKNLSCLKTGQAGEGIRHMGNCSRKGKLRKPQPLGGKSFI